MKDMYHQCETVERCAAGTSEPPQWTLPFTTDPHSAFHDSHHNIFIDGKYQTRGTLVYDVLGLSRSKCKGEIHAGGGTGIAEGSL